MMTTPSDEPPGVEHGRSRRTWLIAGLAVVVLAVGGFAGAKAVSGGSGATAASAQSAGQNAGAAGGRGTVGTLQSVDGTTLTVATRNGSTTTVITSSSTKFAKAVTGALTDIKVGDRVNARGTADGAAIAAQRITDSGTLGIAFGGGGQGRRPGGGGTPPSTAPGVTRPDNAAGATGTVKAITGSTLTVAQNDGTTKTVTTSASTAVSVVKASSLQDLTTGQTVMVQGKTNSDGTVTATAVEEGLGGFGPGRGGPPGAGAGGQ
jgi:hypothetical protein